MNLPVSGHQLALGTPYSGRVVKAAIRNLRNGSTNEVNLADENMNKLKLNKADKHTLFLIAAFFRASQLAPSGTLSAYSLKY